jgi:thiamine-monophosphate kinase
VRIELSLGSLPLTEGVAEVAGELGIDPGAFAATAGEDYELCVCVPPERRGDAERAAPLTWVGEVLEGPPGAVFRDGGGERSLVGFEHVV